MDSIFLVPKILGRLQWGHPQLGRQMPVGLVKIGSFDHDLE